MADATYCGATAPDFKRSRIKPEVYKTVEGKTVVEDELLNFLAIKIKTMTQDEIVVLAVNYFDSEWIEASKKLLFELCPTTQRCVSHKGSQKDVNNIKSCLKVLNECGDNIPRFVSHYLDDLPPVTFSSLDISSLLGKLERMQTEVCAMKQAMQLQADVSDSLRAVTADVDRRVNALECRDSGGSAVLPPCNSGGTERGPASIARPLSGAARGEPLTAAAVGGTAEASTAAGTTAPTLDAELELTAASPGGATRSPKWSQVVKRNRRPQNAALLTTSQSASFKRSKKAAGATVIGTGASGDIKTVRTKLVSVFATRFHPALDADVLALHLKDKLGREVMCQRVGSASSRFSSFKVSAECNEVSEMYAPQIWPEGSLVRRYYEPRKIAVVGQSTSNEGDSVAVRGP